MADLVLRPQTRYFEADGRKLCFGMPLFASRLSSDGDLGLYMSVREYGRDDITLYLHMPLAYVQKLMTGWFIGETPTESEIMAFAVQNENNLAHFVIGLQRHDLEPDETVIVLGNEHLNVLTLRMPKVLA